MPSFVYSNRSLSQWDDADGQPPTIQLTAPPIRATSAGRTRRSTLATLIAEQERENAAPPPPGPLFPLPRGSRAPSIFTFAPPTPRTWHLRLADAIPTPTCSQENGSATRASPLAWVAVASLATCWLLLLLALTYDAFALTAAALPGGSSVTAPTPVTSASEASHIGAFSYCQAGYWASEVVDGVVDAWTFVVDPHCWYIDSTCSATGLTLSGMMGGQGSVACGVFLAFRVWLVLAFVLVTGALLGAALHLAWPTRSRNGAITAISAAAALSSLLTIALCAALLHSSAAGPSTRPSSSFNLVIAAFILALLAAFLWSLSERHRLRATTVRSSSSPSAIPASLSPARLREDSDQQRVHEPSMYTLDEDDGALLEVTAACPVVAVHPPRSEEKVEEGGKVVKQAAESGTVGGGVVRRKRRRERKVSREKEAEEEADEDRELDAMMLDTASGGEGVDDGDSFIVVDMDDRSARASAHAAVADPRDPELVPARSTRG